MGWALLRIDFISSEHGPQMAIADAVMEHLVDGIKCKTLFITHYPLVASNLESQYPMEVQNLHMGYEEDSRIDGTREITFLYRLLPGMATGKSLFGLKLIKT